MINHQNAQLVALELWRFYAHCVAVFVVAGAVLIGGLVSWVLALKIGALPLLALFLVDVLIRRHDVNRF